MKTLILILSYVIATHSQSLYAVSEAPENYSEMINAINDVQNDLKKSGTIDPGCTNCIKTVEPDKRVELKNKEEALDRAFNYKNNVPYVIHLKRTKETPTKVSLKFKNGHTECGKMFVGANPLSPNGSLVVGCIINITVFEDYEIDLNLKKLPALAEGEEQIIELKLTKPKVENSYFLLEADVVKGPSTSVEKDKKFWGSGYNLVFSPSDRSK